ncbi:MAG: MoaD/ThiS family protein [Methanosphaera stadtmanae]|nr:MoaD/ThiS family protein [Methanosphaera stadtmanae]
MVHVVVVVNHHQTNYVNHVNSWIKFMKKLEELMKMTIKFINKKDIKEMDYEENLKVEDILKREDIPIETVVVKINGITVTEDEVVNDNDEVEVIKVIYGG